ncbi:hypothetical protein ACFL6H_10235, partial [Candidatus Latescibacterota bacterium]
MVSRNKDYWRFMVKIAFILLMVAHLHSAKAQVYVATKNLLIWDTMSPFTNQINLQDKTGWASIDADTVDNYVSKGDIIIENEYFSAVFSSKNGTVGIYTNLCEALQKLHRGYLRIRETGVKRIEFIPLGLKGKEVSMVSCKIVSKTPDEVTIEVTYSVKEAGQKVSAVFTFGNKQIIEVKPTDNITGISISSVIDFAIVPNFISDDLIFDAGNYVSNDTIELPLENMFSGLIRGNDSMLVITWPDGNQEMKLVTETESEKGPFFGSVDITNDGKSMYLALLDAPDIWHKEELKPSYLERDVAVSWNRPFHAKWITQLYEDEIRTTFPFKRPETPYFRGEAFFRSGLGTYTYPLWFRSDHLGDRPYYRLGKKIQPTGDSIIYFLEGRDNIPVPVSSPADIMKQTLGILTFEKLYDSEGRLTRSLRRTGILCNSATCHVTS